MARVLIVAAHPDDELLGVGGTILRHKARGDSVHVHIECVAELRDKLARMQDAAHAAFAGNYDLTFGDSPQLGYIVPDLTVHPDFDIVYTHHPDDLNRDHGLVSEAVRVASRPFTSNVRSFRYFETPSSTEWGSGFQPQMFVDITVELDEKIRLIERYDSELRPWPHPRSARALIDRARYWGSVSGFEAAEPFVIGRERW